MSILSEKEVATLKTMSLYWQEVLGRSEEECPKRGYILSCELRQATEEIGSEKTLRIINEYVKGLSDKEPT